MTLHETGFKLRTPGDVDESWRNNDNMLTTIANEHAFAWSNAHCQLNFVLCIITSASVSFEGKRTKRTVNDRFGSRQLESYGVCWGFCRQVGLRWTWVALSSSSFDCRSILESTTDSRKVYRSFQTFLISVIAVTFGSTVPATANSL